MPGPGLSPVTSTSSSTGVGGASDRQFASPTEPVNPSASAPTRATHLPVREFDIGMSIRLDRRFFRFAKVSAGYWHSALRSARVIYAS
jgi:hypothetical protein